VLLLVPILSLITASDSGTGWTYGFLNQAFEIAGAQTRTTRLTLLLGLFAVLLVIRAVIRRNITLSQLQMGFVETVRARLAQRLAAASWPAHARVTHLISGDIHRVGTATHYMVEFSAAVVVIAAQIVIAFVLAPLLTAVALVLIASGAAVGFVMLRGRMTLEPA